MAEYMLNDEKLKRLNALDKKKKEATISDSEMTELAELRKEYLSNFRQSFRNHIENAKVIDPEGNDVTPEKVKALQSKKKKK